MSGSGGTRYWNEETQRWEEGDGTRPDLPSPATPPPPARPGFAPAWPTAASTGAAAEETGGRPAEGAAEAAGGPAVSAGPLPAADGSASPAGSPAVPSRPADRPEPAAQQAADHDHAAWPPTQTAGGGVPSAAQDVGGSGGWPPAQWPTGSWPPAGQTAPSAPARGMSRRLVWSVLIGAAAVGVAVSLVLTTVVGGDDEPTAATGGSPSPTGEVSQQNDPSPTPTEESASPTVSAPELPAGYEEHVDAEGFRIAIPEGWARTTLDSQFGIAVVNYRSADSQRRLQVYQVSEESPDASFDLYLSEDTPKPAGFEKLSLDALDDDSGFTGSRLEYLADTIKGEPDVGTWHVYDERFVAPDGNIYAIAAYGPEADGRDDELELLTTAVDWFCPPLGQCAPASSSFGID
ncbi:hypothetical protein [Streptomyces sp. AC555_RSS877]|uniref:hypothetical protein n=1 Tax=Streptomyces sp. AC555_RSS877 TaxID=2823688 RepID=UPI0020B6FE97|nr:hypothetical protein [Streptomyces sp. AC555_RSS877]